MTLVDGGMRSPAIGRLSVPVPARQFGFRGAARRWWLILAVLVALAARTYGRHARGGHRRIAGHIMGTSYTVTAIGGAKTVSQEALERDVEALLASINGSMSSYDPSSELSRFNRHASREPFAVSRPFAEVLRMALEVSRASHGLFDPTVAPIVDAWGFGAAPRPAGLPGESMVTALRANIGYAQLSLEGHQLRKEHPAVRVDLSAIAKGYAVDRISALLDRYGYENYLVEVGGELRARGRKAPADPFRVGIEAPQSGRRAVRAVVALKDMSMATSGNYRNHYELGGERVAHIVDPRFGRPVRHGLLSATVLHPECALADAWATALMVAGPEEAWRLARSAGLEVMLLVVDEGALRELATPGFSAHLRQR